MQAVGPDEEVAAHGHLVALQFADLDVADDVADAGERLFGPVEAGVDLADAARERALALVEPRNLGFGVGVLAVLLAELDVAADGHVVVDVLGDELDPVVEAAVVEEFGLAVEEALDVALEEEAFEGLLRRRDGDGPREAGGALRAGVDRGERRHVRALEQADDVGGEDHLLVADERRVRGRFDEARAHPAAVARVRGDLGDGAVAQLHLLPHREVGEDDGIVDVDELVGLLVRAPGCHGVPPVRVRT